MVFNSHRLFRNIISRATRRFLTTSIPKTAKALPARPKINENDIEESFIKGTGPGGQVINKTSSAVQIKHLPSGLVVKSQATRSREQNRKIARRILADKLDLTEKGEKSRVAIKAERERKRKASAAKKSKRKYRRLEEGEERALEDLEASKASGSSAETSQAEVGNDGARETGGEAGHARERL